MTATTTLADDLSDEAVDAFVPALEVDRGGK